MIPVTYLTQRWNALTLGQRLTAFMCVLAPVGLLVDSAFFLCLKLNRLTSVHITVVRSRKWRRQTISPAVAGGIAHVRVAPGLWPTQS